MDEAPAIVKQELQDDPPSLLDEQAAPTWEWPSLDLSELECPEPSVLMFNFAAQLWGGVEPQPVTSSLEEAVW
eukprot:8294611-Alexandrium_andersonii.AAC.2